MTDVVHLRTAVAGLLGFAAAEEEMLLTAVPVTGSRTVRSGGARWPR